MADPGEIGGGTIDLMLFFAILTRKFKVNRLIPLGHFLLKESAGPGHHEENQHHCSKGRNL